MNIFWIDTTMKKLCCALALAGAALLTSATANATTVEFTADRAGIEPGTFTGTDTNNDGFLTLGELTSASLAGDPFFGGGGFLGLTDFGSFNLTTGVWNNDAQGYAYAIWATGLGHLDLSNNVTITSYVPDAPPPTSGGSVPEPATLALLGLAGLGFLRRQKAA